MGTELGPNTSLLALGEHFLGKDQEMTDLVDLGGTFSLSVRKRRRVTLSIRQWIRPFIPRIEETEAQRKKNHKPGRVELLFKSRSFPSSNFKKKIRLE